jgi:hypothetical protein
MIRLLRVGTGCAAAALAAAALAQSASMLQRFPLHQAIPEPGITACLSQDVPIRVNTLLAAGKQTAAAEAFERALLEGQCINGAGVVIYTRQVHRLDAEDGSVWTVYQGRAGKATFYVPMHGYLHEDMTI